MAQGQAVIRNLDDMVRFIEKGNPSRVAAFLTKNFETMRPFLFGDGEQADDQFDTLIHQLKNDSKKNVEEIRGNLADAYKREGHRLFPEQKVLQQVKNTAPQNLTQRVLNTGVFLVSKIPLPKITIPTVTALAGAAFFLQGSPDTIDVETLASTPEPAGTSQKFEEVATSTPTEAVIVIDNAVQDVTGTSGNFNESVVTPKEVAQATDIAVQEVLQEVTAKIHTFQDVAAFVIVALEGDDKIVNEPDGAIAKFGINSNAYPNVDVSNLTRDQAYQITKTDFWDLVDADNLPENFRLVAVDTVFNHGRNGGRALIEKANNDPLKLLELRLAEYQRLVREAPEKYEKYESGWVARLDRLRDQLNIPLAPATSPRPPQRPAPETLVIASLDNN